MSSGMSQDRPHRQVTKRYNYDKEIQELYGKLKNLKKNELTAECDILPED